MWTEPRDVNAGENDFDLRLCEKAAATGLIREPLANGYHLERLLVPCATLPKAPYPCHVDGQGTAKDRALTAALGMAFTAPAVVTASGEGPHVPQGPYRGIGKAGNASGSD